MLIRGGEEVGFKKRFKSRPCGSLSDKHGQIVPQWEPLQRSNGMTLICLPLITRTVAPCHCVVSSFPPHIYNKPKTFEHLSLGDSDDSPLFISFQVWAKMNVWVKTEGTDECGLGEDTLAANLPSLCTAQTADDCGHRLLPWHLGREQVHWSSGGQSQPEHEQVRFYGQTPQQFLYCSSVTIMIPKTLIQCYLFAVHVHITTIASALIHERMAKQTCLFILMKTPYCLDI